MGRKLGSKNKGKRAAPRSPYETYSYWYDKYTKGKKAKWFSDKLTEKEFEAEYDLARRAKVPNPARSIAQSQEFVERKFERQYKKLYGKDLGDLRDKAEREQIFIDFVNEMQAQGLSYDGARDEFEKYFY